jgi:hypothetical protein
MRLITKKKSKTSIPAPGAEMEEERSKLDKDTFLVAWTNTVL